METRELIATVPLGLADRIERIAEQMQRSPAWVMEEALSTYVVESETRRRLTLDGLADMDAGRLIDEEDVTAWATRLGTPDERPTPQPR